MSTSHPAAATSASSAKDVTMIRKPHSTGVNWDEVYAIATKVQRALNAAKEFDEHPDYESVYEMWMDELADASTDGQDSQQQQLSWYTSANDYWDNEANCPLSDNGVLGGFAHVSPADITDSKIFLDRVQTLRPQWQRNVAVDCGAGIGRVTKLLLLPTFQQVDLVEQSPRLLQSVPQYLGHENRSMQQQIRSLYCMGLQEFDPPANSYDLIWIQWVLSHLTDVDLVHFLRRCQQALKPHGWIGIKENMLQSGLPYDIDRQDSSITRSVVYFKSLFEQAGLTIITEQTQRNFPEELYPVKMFALV